MFLHTLMTLLDFLLFRRDLLAFLLAFLLNFTSSHQIDRQSVFLCFQIRNKFNFQNQLTSLLIKTKRSSTRHQQYMRTFCTRKTSKTKVTKSPLSSKNNGEFSIELGIPQNEVNALRRLWRGGREYMKFFMWQSQRILPFAHDTTLRSTPNSASVWSENFCFQISNWIAIWY